MISEPQFVDRAEQHYVAIRTVVPMQEIATHVPPLIPQVYEWLGKRGEEPAGPLFFRYIRMDEGKNLDLEVGIPVRDPLSGDDEIRPGSFPAGLYAVARYKGGYEHLPGAWRAFEEWRTAAGIREEGQIADSGDVRGTRAECYLIGPNDNPDPAHWETELLLYLGPSDP